MGKVTAPGDEPTDSPALAAMAALGRDAAHRPTVAELDAGLGALRARIATRASRRRALVTGSLLGVTAAVLVVAFVRLTPAWRGGAPPPETREVPVEVARIAGGTLLEGGYLSASGEAGIELIFSEGSEFALGPGTRGRLRAVTPQGARLAIEHGAASFTITPSRTHHWIIDAGPFEVTVKGTVFSLSWDPNGERFELRLRRGRVSVKGPAVGGGIDLSEGQRLVVNLPRGETLISDEALGAAEAAPGTAPAVVEAADASSSRAVAVADGASPAGASAARAPAGQAPAPHGPERLASPVARASTAADGTPSAGGAGVVAAAAGRGATRRWAALLAAGQWDRILAEADRDGVDATLAQAPSEDLFALADAARYRRRAALARAALLSERRRFPASGRALDALFLLGRVEEMGDAGATGAITYYDQYLARAPRGAYAAEALGRKMILMNDAMGADRARPIADEYLRRFPEGSYAGSARALTIAP